MNQANKFIEAMAFIKKKSRRTKNKMADQELKVTLTLSDQLTTALSKTQDGLNTFGDNLRSASRELVRVGSIMTGFGAGMSAPFIAALASVSNSSFAVHEQFRQLGDVSDQLSQTIATAVLPVFERKIQVLENMVVAFNALDPQVKNFILQGTFAAGMLLTIVGVSTLVIGKLGELFANVTLLTSKFVAWVAIPANAWFMEIAAAIVVVIALMVKYKDVADVVLSTFQILFLFLKNGFLAVKAANELFVSSALSGIADVLAALAKVPGPSQTAFTNMANAIRNASANAQILADRDLHGIIVNSQQIGSILASGQGTWSKGFDNLKTSANAFWQTMQDGTKKFDDSEKQLNTELIKLSDQLLLLQQKNSNRAFLTEQSRLQDQIKLNQFYNSEVMKSMQGMAAFTVQIGQTIQTSLSGALTDFITGVKSANDAFKEFGQALIKVIIEFVAQKAVAFAIETAMLALSVKAAQAAGAKIAAAYAGAALAANIATMGGAGLAAAATTGIATGALIAAMGAVTSIGAGAGGQVGGAIGMATGGDMIVSRPTLFLAGEAGPERAIFQPLNGRSGGSGGKSIHIQINNPQFNSRNDIQLLAQRIGLETERRLRRPRGATS